MSVPKQAPARRKLGEVFLPSTRGRGTSNPLTQIKDHIQLHLEHLDVNPGLVDIVLEQHIDWATHHFLVARALLRALSTALNSSAPSPPPHSKLPFSQLLLIQLVRQLCTVAQILRIRGKILLKAPDPPFGDEARRQSFLDRLQRTVQTLHQASRELVRGFLPPKYGWLLENWHVLNKRTPAAGIPTNTVLTLAIQIWLCVKCRNTGDPWALLRKS